MMIKRQKKIDYKAELESMGQDARQAARKLATLQSARKERCLKAMADAIMDQADPLREANDRDLAAGEERGLSQALLDRLALTTERIEDMAKGLRVLAGLPDPVGRVDSTWIRPNGLKIRKVRVPIGVIGIVYESRPNVTADAAGLCLKAGNAVFLRGGSEAINSNLAIASALRQGLQACDLPAAAVQLLPWTDREAVGALLRLDRYVDLIIPRGGEGLIRAVVENSTIPVIKHYKGVCHAYVDSDADLDMATAIVENAKCQRPGVCNALETLLIHRQVAPEFAPRIGALLAARGVELRGDTEFCRWFPEAAMASAEDWGEEFLDLVLAVRVVDSIEAAIEHIATYGSGHSDAIVTESKKAASLFTESVDSAAVYVNASTRFTDGSQFGMGAEIGISTDRIHARGPMGIDELTTYKYVIDGSGQIRT